MIFNGITTYIRRPRQAALLYNNAIHVTYPCHKKDPFSSGSLWCSCYAAVALSARAAWINKRKQLFFYKCPSWTVLFPWLSPLKRAITW